MFDSAQIAQLTDSGLEGQTAEVGIDYVEIPVLLRWNFPLVRSRFRPYLQGGPAFGWRLDCGVMVSAASAGGAESESNCDDLNSENIEETLNSYETGLVLGGGVAAAVLSGRGAISLDLRLTRGLSRLSEGMDGPDVRNQAFTAMLGYTFGFY